MPVNASAPKQSGVEIQVLEVVQGLLRELGSPRALRALSLKASLERDLGLGSLERVELLDRLEKRFGFQLPDQVLAEAETPADLVTAVFGQKPLPRGEGQSDAMEVAETGFQPEGLQKNDTGVTEAPPGQISAIETAGIETLNQALLFHARNHPAAPHVYLYESGEIVQTLSYGTLLEAASAVSSGLAGRGLQPGETVALMLPTGEEFFFAFFGILLAGAVPVPIYPPFRANRLEEYAQRQSRILQNAEVRFLITFRPAEKLARLLKPGIPSLKGVLTVAELTEPKSRRSFEQVERQLAAGSNTALIQYTSGSTGDPKGVVLTHSNLLANIRAIGSTLNLQPDDVGVSWLPLYHDMGLIGSWLCALTYGVPIAILSPLDFLSRPERWLWAIHRHRATVSPAPNFAYELCARKIEERSIEGLDLSCWRVALNGAEPVSPETLDRFVRRFRPYGFRPESFLPAYGLAESSVGLTLPPLGRRPRVDTVEREHFEKTGEARPGLRSDVAPLRFVCAGTALPGHEVRVVDDDALEAGERKQGHIQFRGPSTMQGYFGNLASTREVIRDDGWVETGDLGYLADGELFVTARQKDVIIKGGRNLYPQEVEEICGEVAGVRRGCVAAFGILDSAMGTEKLVVVAETRETVPEALDEIAAGIVSRVDEQLGLPPDTVKLVRPQSVPKTSSGKIRRDACKQLYLSGGLERKPLPSWLQVSKLLLLSLLKRGRQAGQAIIQVLYGGYAWVVMSVLMITGWLLVFPLPRTRASRVSSILRFVSRVALRLTGLNPRLEGQEQLEEAKLQLNMNQQPYLLVSNHASYVDPLIVTAVCPFDVCFVSKSDAAVWPLIGTFIRKCRFLTVDREDLRQSTRVSDSIVQQLKQGVAVHVFPEATFTPAAGLRPFQMGAFKAAVEAGCPVLPVTLAGTRSVLRDGTWLPRHAALRVTVGAPLWPQGNNWRDIVRLRDAVREEFLKHCGEAPLDLVLAGPPR